MEALSFMSQSFSMNVAKAKRVWCCSCAVSPSSYWGRFRTNSEVALIVC